MRLKLYGGIDMKTLLAFLTILIMTIGCYDDTSTPTKTVYIENPEQEIVMLRPIAETNNYFLTQNNELYAMTKFGMYLQEIKTEVNEPLLLVDFFRKDFQSYFTILVYELVDNPDYDSSIPESDPDYEEEKILQEIYFYYRQKNGQVFKIDVLPEKPIIERTEFDNGTFNISEFNYNGKICSDIWNKSLDTTPTDHHFVRFFLVNGNVAFFQDYGIYFNVADGLYSDTVMVREKGLYYWGDGETSPIRLGPDGELW